MKKYVLNNPGIHYSTITYLKNKYSHLKAIGMDLISVSSYKNREEGRKTHKTALKTKRPILLIEDMDLNYLDNNSIIKELLIIPLWIDNADALPVTILAKIK